MIANRERKSAATAATETDATTNPKGTNAKSVVPFAVKASDDSARTITGLAAAWTLDSYDDVIEPGAFKRTLQNWRSSQKAKPIPLLDQHDYRASRSVLGKMTDAEETDDGLLATFEFIPDDPDADAVYRRVKGGYITGLSIGYRAIRWEYEQKEGGAEWERIRHLKEVALLEVSVVTWPANDDARIESVKAQQFAALADALKHGRLSPAQKSELRALLADSLADTSEDGTPPPPPPSDDEPKGLAPEEQDALRQRLLALKLRSLVARAA